MGFAWQLLLPIETARLQAKIDILQNVDEGRKKAEAENEILRYENKKMMVAVHGTALEVPFIKSSPYATGFEDIRIGEAIAPFIKPTNFKPNPSLDDLTFRFEREMGHFAFVNVAPFPDNRAAIGMVFYANKNIIPGSNSTLIRSVHGNPTLVDSETNVELWKLQNNLWYMVHDYGITLFTPAKEYLNKLGYPG